MRTIAIFCMLLCAATLHAADWIPVKAEITMKKSNKVEILYVTTVSVDKVMAGRDAKGGPQAGMNFRDIAHIEWMGIKDSIDYAKGLGDLSKAKTNLAKGKDDDAKARFERALKSFDRAAKIKKQVVQIKSAQGSAEAYLGLKKYPEAVAALDAVITAHPKWPWLPDIIYRKAEIQMMAGKMADAEATFAGLAKLTGTFGPTVASSSLLGRAEVKVAAEDNVGAAKLLSEAFANTSADSDPALRGRIGLKLAVQQKAAKQDADAQATLDQVKFLPLAANDLSHVHKQLAQILLAKGELKAAFDFAVFGALVPDASDAVVSESRSVARKVQKAIQKDESFSNDEKLAYREAYDKL